MTVAARPTLIQVVVPQTGLLRDALLVLGFSVLIALSAQVAFKLPFTDIPVTGQTFGVLLTGAVLGSRRGGLAVGAYLLEGIAGLPVFALGNNAWSPTRVAVPYIVGPTAGYLFGFPVAAYVVGLLAERGWDRSVERTAVALLIGNVLLYLPGMGWLARYVGAENAIPFGLLPFIPGDLLKLLVVAAALPATWRLLGKPPRWGSETGGAAITGSGEEQKRLRGPVEEIVEETIIIIRRVRRRVFRR